MRKKYNQDIVYKVHEVHKGKENKEMRHKLEEYQGKEKHRFTAKVIRYGSFYDYEKKENTTTILFRDVKSESGEVLTDHVWVRQDSYMKSIALKEGKVYSFEAKVGTYSRGRTARDFQLNKLRQFKAA